MSSCRDGAPSLRLIAATLALVACAATAQTERYQGIGRSATPDEIAAWDIDVRPDFKGLPRGRGTVAQGQVIWEDQCASCHGVFGESNQVFNPLVGGTTKEDARAGRVARLTDPAYPVRTTLMKLPTLSTLWDYIHRAMPWTKPKSLAPDQVYAVTAYLLNLGDIVPDDFELSDANIAQVQARLPNRNGMSLEHALWPGARLARGKVDVNGVACMAGCATETKVASLLPDFARNAHGNLAEQNRQVGAQHGADTAGTAPAAGRTAPPADAKPAAATTPDPAVALIGKHGCTSCHGVDTKVVGPSFREVSSRHGGAASPALAKKIKEGGAGAWGQIPMPAQTLPDADARTIAEWIAAGARP
jgi:S-disulfanyl-L-cysteine oxidoreductase SoxD